MKILVASDSFKGTFSSLEVAGLIEKGVKRAMPEAEVRSVPVADGGEGTVDAIVQACGGEYIDVPVHGPLGDTVTARYGITGDGTAVIEMSAASGICLVPREKLNPLLASTYGTGELVIDAINRGCKKIIIGIGGSATNDGGTGFARAIGVKLLDANGNELDGTGEAARRVHAVQTQGIDKRLKDIEILVACDVDNPLCGEKGASAVFGPQKGATPEMVALLDKNLRNYSEAVARATGRDIASEPGMGAAGGLGFSILQYCNARTGKGIEIVLDTIGFDAYASWADIVITGEGRVDFQTPYGKTPAGVAKRAGKYGKPVYAIAGFEGKGAQAIYDCGIAEVVSAVYAPCTIDEAIAASGENIPRAAERLMRIIKPFLR